VSFLDNILQGGATAADLATTDVPVNVSNSTPPNPGDVLKAVDATHATWQPGGGAGSDAGGLETTGDPVDVSNAAPPVAGQVLTAIDATHAEWRVPGLHYDPGIKFWTNSVGSATIGPGTWGFISQPADGVTPVVVYIVSSLEAPPVDSRFGLYVGRDVTVPVTVSVLGASQIQGTDGVLGSSTALLPGSDYEWVFYHEDTAALWGLVSDTAGIAKRIAVDGGYVEVASSGAPVAGQALVALDAEHAAWSDLGSAMWPTLADAFEVALYVDAIVPADDDLYGNSGPIDGVDSGDIVVLTVGQIDPSENGFWRTYDGYWVHPSGYPLQADTTVGQLVVVRDGTGYAGSMWTYRGDGRWDQISPASPITGGDFMTRVGNAIHLVGPITDGVHGNRAGGALHADATTTVSGFFSGAEKVKLAGIQASAAAVSSTAPTQITVTTAAAGAATDAARRDHVHSVSVGTPSSLTVGGSNSGGSSSQLSRGDHVHALPAFGTGSGQFCQGNDSRLSDDRTASGLRTASTVVSVSAAAAPVANAVLCALNGSSASWVIPAFDPAANGFRISHNADDSASGDGTFNQIYLAHAASNAVALFDTTAARWLMRYDSGATGGITYPLSGRTPDLPFDMFIYWTGSALALEVQNWASGTARAALLPKLAGVICKNGDLSRRYLGTVRPRSATTYQVLKAPSIAGGPAGVDYWNQDNRRQVGVSLTDEVANHGYTTAAWQQCRTDTRSRIDVIAGMAGDPVSAQVYSTANTSNTTTTLVVPGVGIGVNSTSVSSAFSGYEGISRIATAPFDLTNMAASLVVNSTLGVTAYNWLEYGGTGVTFFGLQTNTKSGMHAIVWF